MGLGVMAHAFNRKTLEAEASVEFCQPNPYSKLQTSQRDFSQNKHTDGNI